MVPLIAQVVLGGLLSALAWPTLAASEAPPAAADALSEQRELFLEATRAAQSGDWATYTRHEPALRAYPLVPYLELARLEALGAKASDTQLEAFLERYPDVPIVARVRNDYLRRLAASGRWKTFLKAYQGRRNVTLRCHQATALWRTGATAAAREHTQALWRTGDSLPDACDPALAALRKAGAVSAALVLERVELAVKAGNVGLAKYLERYLPKSLRTRAAFWRTLRTHPERISGVAPGDHAQAEAMTEYAIRRLMQRDADAAVRLWARLGKAHRYSQPLRRKVARHIGLGLATDHEPRAVDWLAAVDDAVADEDLRAWRILSALRHGRTAAARAGLERLPAAERTAERWQYWDARVLEMEGDADAALRLFRKLATGRSFYGFLAADRASRPYALAADERPPPPAAMARLGGRAEIARARELLALDRPIDARREWFAMLDTLSEDDLATAAYVAHRWDWHGAAILTMARAKRFDEVSVRFPAPHLALARQAAAASGVETSWIMAVMRQESAFMYGARSSKGALGLMQIMPATGRRIARRLGTRLRRSSALQDPALNVRFGASYLATVRKALGGQQALATAAYNAGPHRVRRWLPTTGTIPGDVWVETIPYRETRQYTRRVLAYQAIYTLRAGTPLIPISERLPAVPTLAVLKAGSAKQAARERTAAEG